MTSFNGPRSGDPTVWFGRLARDLFGPPIEHYVEILMDRLIPIFDDLDGEQQRAAEAVLNAPGWHEYDYDQAVEAAFDYSQEHVLRFMELRSVFLATGVAGLFHLFEKQLYRHLNHELRYNLTSEVKDWKEATKVIETLDRPAGPTGRTALQEAFGDADLKELRLVANAVKHGEGSSYNELKALGSPVVDPTRISDDWTVGPHSVFGVALLFRPEDVRRYQAAVLRFWELEGTFWCEMQAVA